MRAVIQRVSGASVSVENKIVGQINKGLLIFLGVGQHDSEQDLEYLVSKIAALRVFSDEEGKMNLDIKAIQGNCLVISQFTLYANTLKGNRPSFIEAGTPAMAKQYYELFCSKLSDTLSQKVEKGIFGADMSVSLTNNGPVTILIDSKLKQ
jgi:D-tyrosyl-tRNA(Tyr) deacylase